MLPADDGHSIGSTAPQGWRTGYVIALIILGPAFMIAFVVWELYVDNPLIPMSIFKNKDLSLVRTPTASNPQRAHVPSCSLFSYSGSSDFRRPHSGSRYIFKEYGIRLP
jgi:hypothetical protein